MSHAKSFDEEKIATIQSWADHGDGLSEIQKKLSSEMEVKVTYMELRFLLADIGVNLKPEEKPEPAKEEDEPEEGSAEEEMQGELAGDEARVSISALQRPGALISGTVNFADGMEAEWWLDQMGQLGMNPKSEGFQPSQEQMMSFQKELQKAVKDSGF